MDYITVGQLIENCTRKNIPVYLYGIAQNGTPKRVLFYGKLNEIPEKYRNEALDCFTPFPDGISIMIEWYD